MHLAVNWVVNNCTPDTSILIATDSQSLCEFLAAFGHAIKELRSKLLSMPQQIAIQWIPGHKNIIGNEWADAAAKRATVLDEPSTPIPYNCARACIKSAIKDTIDHQRTARVYAKISKNKEAKVRTRIRSGHHWGLESYHNLVDDQHDTKCTECGWELHDLEHWLCSCPASSHIRMKLFGAPEVDLSILTEDPLAGACTQEPRSAQVTATFKTANDVNNSAINNNNNSSSSSDNRRPLNTHNHQNNCATRSSTHQLL